MLTKEMERPTKSGPVPTAALPSGFWDVHFAPFCEKYFWVLAIGLIAIACGRIMSTYDALSLTNDEPTHFGCGLEYLAKHVYRFESQHPPLSRAMQALGPYLAGVRPAGMADANTDALAALAKAGHFDRMLFLMRLGNLPFFIIACVVVCIWGRKFGAPVAILALALFTLLPTMLADAGVATTDMALGANVGATFLAVIYWLKKPTIWRSLLLGLCTALACLSKFTAMGYLPAAGALALACYLAVSWPGLQKLWSSGIRLIVPFGVALSVTAFLIWAAYWFSIGPALLHGVSFNKFPAPEFWDGIRVAVRHSHDGHGAFLLGHFSWQGWWFYFPIVLMIKTPIAFLILLALGTLVCLRKYVDYEYLLPIAFSLGILLPAMHSHVDIGVRHVEPIYLSFSVIAALGLKELLQWSRKSLASVAVAGALVLWMIVSVAVTHPDYLTYVNAFAGKHPENVVVDSNYDWGQDLRLLSKYLRKNNVHQFSMAELSGVGRADLQTAWYGLPASTNVDVCKPSVGVNVVGPTIKNSLSYWPNAPLYYRGNHKPWYELVQPDTRVGSLMIYHIPAGSTLTCR